MKFQTIGPNGSSITVGSSLEGDNQKVPSPKALMLSSLAVCSGIDVVSILEKMKVKLNDFKINTIGSLTQEHPKYYNKVSMEYHFYGEQLDKEKFTVQIQNMSISDSPVIITQSEFMRRMKEQQALGGGGMQMFGNMPDAYNLMVNSNHELINKIFTEKS